MKTYFSLNLDNDYDKILNIVSEKCDYVGKHVANYIGFLIAFGKLYIDGNYLIFELSRKHFNDIGIYKIKIADLTDILENFTVEENGRLMYEYFDHIYLPDITRDDYNKLFKASMYALAKIFLDERFYKWEKSIVYFKENENV